MLHYCNFYDKHVHGPHTLSQLELCSPSASFSIKLLQPILGIKTAETLEATLYWICAENRAILVTL